MGSKEDSSWKRHGKIWDKEGSQQSIKYTVLPGGPGGTVDELYQTFLFPALSAVMGEAKKTLLGRGMENIEHGT